MSFVVIWSNWRLIERDRHYRDTLHAIAARIEAWRVLHGELPMAREVETMGGDHVAVYERFVDRAESLRAQGASSENDYAIGIYRRDDSVWYYSWSGEDTIRCDAWISLLSFGGPLAGASVWLISLSVRRRRMPGA